MTRIALRSIRATLTVAMPDAKMSETLFFEPIKEHRGLYFVEYQPPIAANSFATLNLVFPDTVKPSRASEFMETELRSWLARYPVPLMVSAFDAKEDVIRIRDDDFLVGWLIPKTGEIASSWKIDDLSAFVKTLPAKPDWRIIYRDVPFRTDTQVQAEAAASAKERRRQNRFLKIVFSLWLAAIPAGFAIFEYFGPEWLGLIALIFILWKAWRTWLKIMGWTKLSRSGNEKAERERKMGHYYYHCERNPDGFSRLKAENFEKDIRERTREEATKLARDHTRT